MDRDWGLFAIGVGIVVLSGCFAVPALLVYGDLSGCDRNPMDDVSRVRRPAVRSRRVQSLDE